MERNKSLTLWTTEMSLEDITLSERSLERMTTDNVFLSHRISCISLPASLTREGLLGWYGHNQLRTNRTSVARKEVRCDPKGH